MFQERATFESIFTRDICSVLLEFLTLPEIFTKFNLLNRNFYGIY